VTTTAKSLPISIGLTTWALALGYARSGLWAWTSLIVALGGLWLLGQWRGWGWMASVGLVFFVVAAAAGLWLNLATGWMLLGVVAALATWDLDHFVQRLRSVGGDETPAEQWRELEQRHLRRLLIVDGLGLLLALVALEIKVKLSFGIAFSLGLLAVLGLSRVIGFLRRESE
jgi:hypothetical protein